MTTNDKPTPAAPLDLDAAMWIVPGHAGDREWQVTGPDAEQRAKAVAAVTGTKPYPLYRIDALALIARVREAEAGVERLRAGLTEALDLADEGWSYAEDYFRDKHLDPDDVKRLRALAGEG